MFSAHYDRERAVVEGIYRRLRNFCVGEIGELIKTSFSGSLKTYCKLFAELVALDVAHVRKLGLNTQAALAETESHCFHALRINGGEGGIRSFALY